MKTIILTGGTGLVGRAICDALIKENYQIILLSRKKNRISARNLKHIQIDLGKVNKKFFQNLPSVDGVVHAAATVRLEDKESEFESYRKVNMEFSEILFSWCSTLGKKDLPVVYISGLNFLRKPLEDKITENHPLSPLTIYGLSKYWGELALFKFSEGGKYRPVSLRPSSPIAFEFNLMHETVVTKWIKNARKKKPIEIFGQGKRSQNFVATVDIAQAVVRSLESKNAEGIYNIASENSISMIKLANLINDKIPTIIKRSIDKNESDKEHWNISIQKAKKELGYKPKYKSEEVIVKLIKTIL